MAITNSDVEYSVGIYGAKAVLRGSWSPSLQSEMEDKHISELELNTGKGWFGNDIRFVSRFPRLRSLTVLDQGLQDVEPIHSLHYLEALNLSAYCKTKIRFNEFPQLRDCGFEWRPGSETLFDCKGLRRLFVNRYPGESIEPFLNLTGLESLSIYSSPITSLDGLGKLNVLAHLKIVLFRKLKLLNALADIPSLKVLEIINCRAITDIRPVGKLIELEVFRLDNCSVIDSLRPLETLTKLHTLSFAASTVIRDGDFSFLARMLSLKAIAFQSRRHYSHRATEIVMSRGDRIH